MSQQWEYCAVYSSIRDGALRAGVTYYGPSDIRLDFNRDQLSAAFHTLGRAGWEMVGIDRWSNTLGGGTIWYFKRPVEGGRNIDEPKLVL
jgi:hypothetical protein